MNLLIELHLNSGHKKTWKVYPNKGHITFGTSNQADLISPDQNLKGIQGVFEFVNGLWNYANLDIDPSIPTLTIITNDCEIKFKNSTLKIRTVNHRDSLSEKLKRNSYRSPSAEKPMQLVTILHNNKILKTQILASNESFNFDLGDEKLSLPWTSDQEFKSTLKGKFEIQQKTISLEKSDHLSRLPKNSMLDDGSKHTFYAIGIGAALLGLMFLISPESKDAAEIALESRPPIEIKNEVVLPRKKRMDKSQVADRMPASAPAPAANNKQTGGSQAVSALKAFTQSRISQLIGKVSKGASKSVNVVVGSGLVAGSAETGRALASVGNVDQSGKDWSKAGSGTGFKVGTAGIAGGKGVGGMGTLANGKTGMGGAELIEDEGEITGGLDREVIAQYIKSQLGQILYCYERQLSADPNLFGKVSVRFTIGGTGSVVTQNIGDTTLKNSSVEGCILQKVAKWKFPTPEGGTKVMVTYPFFFKSTH